MVSRVGRRDPKRHLQANYTELMSANILQVRAPQQERRAPRQGASLCASGTLMHGALLARLALPCQALSTMLDTVVF